MGMTTQWSLNGKAATGRDVAEALALYRQTVAKLSKIEREAGARDADARAVGAAIRRALKPTVGCKPRRVVGRRDGGVRLRQFEQMLGLLTAKKASSSKDGFSSFHLAFTPRGLGSHRRAKHRGYQQGEAIRAIRYILREIAREIAGGGIVSNISQDPDDIATLFNAVEELELTAGRDNANVYTSVVIALPHELDSAARERVLQSVCAIFGKLGLPHAGVLHKPDPERDERNHHAHLMFSWRPFAITEDGYAFATGTLGSSAQAGFISSVRKCAADAMNLEMAKAGLTRRFLGEKRVDQGVATASGKDGPGKKHRERRVQSITAMKSERALVGDRQAAINVAISAIESIMIRPEHDRSLIMRDLAANEHAIAAAARSKVTQTALLRVPSGNTSAPTFAPQRAVSGATPEKSGASTPELNHGRPQSPEPVAPSLASIKPAVQSPIGPALSPAAANGPVNSKPVSHEKPLPGGLKDQPRSPELPAPTGLTTRAPLLPPSAPIHEIVVPPGLPLAAPKRTAVSVVAAPPAAPLRDVPKMTDADASVPQPAAKPVADQAAMRPVTDPKVLALVARLKFPVRAESPDQKPYRTGLLQTLPGMWKLSASGNGLPPGVLLRGSLNARAASLAPTRNGTSPTPNGADKPLRQSASAARREARRRESISQLSAMSYLPILPVATGDDGRERFTLVPEMASAADTELIRNAREFESDAAMQELLASKFSLLLAQIRHLLLDRDGRSDPKEFKKQVKRDPQLEAAVAVAWGHPAVEHVLKEAKAEWDQRDFALLTAQAQRKNGKSRS